MLELPLSTALAEMAPGRVAIARPDTDTGSIESVKVKSFAIIILDL
jgi:hypothetical protein